MTAAAPASAPHDRFDALDRPSATSAPGSASVTPGGQAVPDAAAPAQPRPRPLQRLARAHARAPEPAALDQVRAIVGAPPPEGHPRDRLIEHLHALNDRCGGLYRAHLLALAHDHHLSPAQVGEVAGFYHHFDVCPDGREPPRLRLRVCDGLACRMAGADALAAQAAQLAAGDTGLQVLRAPCMGHCEHAPAASANGVEVAPLLAATLPQVLAQAPRCAADAAAVDWPWAWQPPVALDAAAYRAAGGYALAAALVNGEEDSEGVLEQLQVSGLRGLGGAGFGSARKWQLVRAQPGPRVLAVNLDEGEPGTFKDRFWVERDPHRLLEGALIAAQVVGCEQVYLYVRDEYAALRATLAQALADLQADPPCPLPVLQLRRGAGAYVCGEESALIASLEGARGEPRLRPPYVAERGVWGRPTLAHNAETLYWLRDLLEAAPAAGPETLTPAAAAGPETLTPAAAAGPTRPAKAWAGLRSYSVSGRVRDPGVKRAPAGISARALIAHYCGGMADGHTLYAFMPGGYSGGLLPAALADLPLDFGTLEAHGAFVGSHALIVLSQADSARAAATEVMRFMAAESCGQCTPCREGTARALALMRAPHWDADTLQALGQVMADASICGLGQAAPNAFRSVLRHFAHELGASAKG